MKGTMGFGLARDIFSSLPEPQHAYVCAAGFIRLKRSNVSCSPTESLTRRSAGIGVTILPLVGGRGCRGGVDRKYLGLFEQSVG
jgi:hypothetical protein